MEQPRMQSREYGNELSQNIEAAVLTNDVRIHILNAEPRSIVYGSLAVRVEGAPLMEISFDDVAVEEFEDYLHKSLQNACAETDANSEMKKFKLDITIIHGSYKGIPIEERLEGTKIVKESEPTE